MIININFVKRLLYLKTNIKTLIISPHADDEVLGCYSFLSESAHVLYAGIEDRPYVSRKERINEIINCSEKTGFSFDVLDFPVNSYQVPLLIPEFENMINRLKPEIVLIPQPSYNQDHRAVYDASVTSLRPHDSNWFVPKVLVFEQPDSILWPHGGEYEPNYFRTIDIEDKLHSYSLYASQVRGHRSPLLVRAMAQVRGAQSGVLHAEGFTVKRIIDKRNLD